MTVGLVACGSVTTKPPPLHPIPASPAIDVSAGGSYSCSLRVDERIACWGQSGDILAGDILTRGSVDPEFQSVDVGDVYICAVTKDGEIGCWSPFGYATDWRPGPFTAVSSGESHICGLRENGTIECWFSDVLYHPVHPIGQDIPPVGSGSFRSVSAGTYHTCGVTDDGAALCWGDNEFGQSSPTEGSFRSVSAGSRHTCGVQTDGSVVCWGSNEPAGDLLERNPGPATKPAGVQNQDTTTSVPEQATVEEGQALPPAGPFQLVSAGFDHTCGIKTDGSLACWGSLRAWEGEPPISERQLTPPNGAFRSVSAGISHNCAVRQDGTVICWGYSASLQNNAPGYVAMSSNGADYLCEQSPVGICWNKNAVPNSDTPPGIPVPNGFTDIIAGDANTCALTDSATIVCWGQTNTPPEGTFKSIAHGCAVTVDGALSCWHPDLLEDGIAPPSGEFSSVSGGQVYNRPPSFCGILSDDSVRCWGYGFSNPRRSPRGTFRHISVHGNNACGVRNDNSLICWQYGFGELEVPPPDGQYQSLAGQRHGAITRPPPDGQYQSVSLGSALACAIRVSGKVACWGYDVDGNTSPPRGKFRSVSVGSAHACGIKVDDTLACWGPNKIRITSTSDWAFSTSHVSETHYGQADPPPGTFLTVAAGGVHTCGIRTDGRAICWGANNDAYRYTKRGTNDYYGQAVPPAGNP